MVIKEKAVSLVEQSDYISRDMSWIQFNYRVLDQVKSQGQSIVERLKFLAITASNLDEFMMVRVGSLYNYIDYNRQRLDYSGLREVPFRKILFEEIHKFVKDQNEFYRNELQNVFVENGFRILPVHALSKEEKTLVANYFKKTIYPMLTPMLFDNYHTFPVLMNKVLIFGVITKSEEDKKDRRKLSFVQIPQNLPRFFEIERENEMVFVPLEEIIRSNLSKLFRNVEIVSVTLFRITRNGEFTLEESEELDVDFMEEVRRKLTSRRTGRVVRIEVEPNYSRWMMRMLQTRWLIEEDNIFEINNLIDFTGLMQIATHAEFKVDMPTLPPPVQPLGYSPQENILQVLKKKDILLYHPFNSFNPVIELLEKAAEDPHVLAIKMTIYRLARNSRITNALLKAAENGKHVSVLFEIKARFDEEKNIIEAKKLQKAGCFVIYGFSELKTHTKMLLIVRKEGEKVTRYVHMSSGNYNEDTSKLYTDIGLLSTNEVYAHDISEFFNAITGHSIPSEYQLLLTAPRGLRNQLIELIRNEAENARQGKPSGIAIKINSLEDKEFIDALYEASRAGVPIKLIVRGICCLRPGRKDLSENIQVYSIVGDLLEHSRIYYFHNSGNPKVYGGSADAMVRSFNKRIESLWLIVDKQCKNQAIKILEYNLMDNTNSYLMQEDGTYLKKQSDGQAAFNSHEELFRMTKDHIEEAQLF